jgi:hypothetical protein
MAFEEGTALFTCQACEAKHSAKWSRLPVREWQFVPCQACGGTLVQGKANRDYREVDLIPD